MESARYDALVLAGRRGPDDPLAAAAGAPHRALLDVNGTPMLERVIATLERSPSLGRLLVSIDAVALLRSFSGLAKRLEAGELEVQPSAGSPSRSVLQGLETLGSRGPILVTTADHALLDPEMVEHFLAEAEDSEADLCVAVVSASRLRARFPDSRRTYLPFRGESYSGANLFAFRTPAARLAAEFWIRAERFRKQPWRLVSAFGPVSLLLFLLRRLDLHEALGRASRSLGIKVRAVEMPFAEAAVDVDRIEDLQLVTRILREREA